MPRWTRKGRERGGLDVIDPDFAPREDVVLLHGGANMYYSERVYGPLRLAAALGAPVFVPDYRLAPEFPYPAALDDAVAVVDWVARKSRTVFLVGDSSGAGLALNVAMRRKVAGLVLLSPWLDAAARSLSYRTRRRRPDVRIGDPIYTETNTRADTDTLARAYWGAALSDPDVHPFCADDISGLAPLFVVVGDAEVLLDDARLFAARPRCAGVQVALDHWPEGRRQGLRPLPETTMALRRVVRWLHQISGRPGKPPLPPDLHSLLPEPSNLDFADDY